MSQREIDLDLPFDDSTFDHAWTQHVAMNIGNRVRLYSEIFGVLKPGGSLAIHDVFPTMIANLGRNLREERVRVVQAVVRRPLHQ